MVDTKFGGVVILYQPDENVIENIKTYITQLDLLIVIDNSEIPNVSIKNRLIKHSNLIYYSENKNFGIAKALNLALQIAHDNKVEWLLTMDQDSYFLTDFIKEYKQIIYSNESLSIVAPTYITDRHKNKKYKHDRELTKVMMSGNMISVSKARSIGGFWEELFIEMVDFEFCKRIRMNRWKIISSSKVFLQHFPGITKNKKILGINFKFSSSSGIRKYYKIRNSMLISKKYGGKLIPYWVYFKNYIKIVFFENRNERKEQLSQIKNAFKKTSS